MKWSEQMRVLNSEDEHYNQLMLDTVTGELFINDELIEVLDKTGDYECTLETPKFDKLIKKYPFFTDIKFLLNCVFVKVNPDFIAYSKCIQIYKYIDHYEINCADIDYTLNIYFKWDMGA